jgi:YbbR domain-containing protein
MKALWEKIVALAGSNLGLKVLALIIAVGLWLAGHRDIERSVEVPVVLRNIPAGLMVRDNRVDYVVLRLTGPRTLVSTFDAETLKVGVDLSAAKPGTGIFPLSSNSLKIPRGVAVSRITPPVINLRIEPVLKRVLPVSVRLANKLPAAYQIAATAINPEKVSVQGPADDVRGLASIETVPIEIEAGRGVLKREVRLSTEGKPLVFAPDQVDVAITVEAAMIVKEYGGVEVQAKNGSGEYNISPTSVYLRFTGPADVLEKFDVGASQVFLDLNGLGVGEHSLPLSFSLPPEIKLLEQKPQQFKVRIMKPKNDQISEKQPVQAGQKRP